MIYQTVKLTNPKAVDTLHNINLLRVSSFYETGVFFPKVTLENLTILLPLIVRCPQGGILYVDEKSITEDSLKNHTYFVGLSWKSYLSGKFNLYICTGRNCCNNIVNIAKGKYFVVAIIPE